MRPVRSESVVEPESHNNGDESTKVEHVVPELLKPSEKSAANDQAVLRESQCHLDEASVRIKHSNKRSAFSINGGVTGFETCKKLKVGEPVNSQDNTQKENEISPTIPWKAVKDDNPESLPEDVKTACVNKASGISVQVGYSFEKLHRIQCNTDTTVGQITVAESKILQIEPPTIAKTTVGSHLSASSKAWDNQIIILHDGQFLEEDKCPKIKHNCPPKLIGLPREQALWYQKGWVALDEMEFYLQSMNHTHLFTTSPFVIPDRPDATVSICRWILRTFEIAAATNNAYSICTVFLFQDHWIPIFLQITEQETSITTTIENLGQVQQLVNQTYPDVVIYTTVSQQAFPADCGFQAVAWIQKTMQQKHGLETSPYPMQPETAVELRQAFARHLQTHSIAQNIIVNIDLGGMLDTTKKKLQQLLENHGVSPDRSESCAQHLIQEIGSSSIQKTLTSSEPWKDLKSKANQKQPPIKIVLAEELKTIIDQKIAAGHQFGRKSNKKQTHQTSSQWKGLVASQVNVPSHVFKQEDGASLEQISVQQFNQHAAGIAIVNIREALPFFSLDRHLSQEGLGLIIFDHQDSRIPDCKQIIRFPATCPDTDEPMLVTAALLQLGKKTVYRNTPEKCTIVEEVRTLVIRALVYKDQYQEQSWTSFVASPVKHVMAQKEFREQPEHTILDVWDRQYLNKHFQRTKPLEAEVFIVSIRVTDNASESILAASGVGGIYYEPRSDSGRSPLQSFGVVWMPRKQFGEVLLAKQTSQFPTWIVRTGDRYGLRAADQHISELHRLHRPDIEYLEGQTMTMYRVGPMPYGTTKQSLQKVFKEWEWKARAGQPQGQDAYGVMWTAQATEPPSHWVFTMGHGDVLITKQQSSKEKASPSCNAPLTSFRTMQHLTAVGPKKSWDRNQQDPWTHEDPWSQTSKAGPSLSSTQLNTIETNIEKRILAQLPKPVAKTEDMELETDVDHRVAHLETQVQQLKETVQQASSSMQSFQHQQAQQNQQLSQQIHTVKHQVDTQNHHLQSMIEGKLEEQMSRIESLLTKRMKTNE